jgi:membrane-bound ClpP family serine protease
MQPTAVLDTLLMCGVPVLQWHGAIDESAVRQCQQVIDSLVRNGYCELVLNLQVARV